MMSSSIFYSIKVKKSWQMKQTNSMALVRKQQPTDRHLSANLVTTFADRGCRVVRETDPHGHILRFIDQSHYYIFQVAPQLYSRGWVDPVPDPLLLIKFGSNENWICDLWICSQEFWPLDHRSGTLFHDINSFFNSIELKCICIISLLNVIP
jgi:hypothetical protein